jgi:hypothetical protein
MWLRVLNGAIEQFFAAKERYPESLDELISEGFVDDDPKIAFFDPWGRRFSYRRVDEGFELFSIGFDGVPYTNDDVTKDRLPSSCVPPGIINRALDKFSCGK